MNNTNNESNQPNQIKFLKRYKLTTFLLIGSFVLIASLITFIYLSPKPDGDVGMYELECFLFFGIAVVMIVIDRILVVFVKYTWLSLYELIAIIIALFIYIDSNKRAKIIFNKPSVFLLHDHL